MTEVQNTPRKAVARSAYDPEERMWARMEEDAVKGQIMTALTVPELLAVAYRARESGTWTDDLAALGKKKKAQLELYAGGPKSGTKMPTTAAEWADREEMRLVGLDIAKGRIAKRTADTFELPEMPTLADLLAEDDEDEEYRIKGLIPAGGRIILSAPMKSGKTTLVGNLIRSLADGDDFLGTYPVTPLGEDATIAVLDTEMSKRQMKQWLRDQGMRNPQRVHPVSLRGRVGSFAIMDDTIRAQWAAQLREMNTEILILDPLGPVFDSAGVDENDNAVGQVLVAIDALAQEAGIGEVFIMHHTGHEGERARGHSKLRGWPDAEWFLRRDLRDEGDSSRYFRAFGRDVDVPETLLSYDTDTRHLTLADPFEGQPINRVSAKVAVKVHSLRSEILAFVTENNGCKLSDMDEAGIEWKQRKGKQALDSLIDDGTLERRQDGPAKRLYLGTSHDDCEEAL